MKKYIIALIALCMGFVLSIPSVSLAKNSPKKVISVGADTTFPPWLFDIVSSVSRGPARRRSFLTSSGSFSDYFFRQSERPPSFGNNRYRNAPLLPVRRVVAPIITPMGILRLPRPAIPWHPEWYLTCLVRCFHQIGRLRHTGEVGHHCSS